MSQRVAKQIKQAYGAGQVIDERMRLEQTARSMEYSNRKSMKSARSLSQFDSQSIESEVTMKPTSIIEGSNSLRMIAYTN